MSKSASVQTSIGGLRVAIIGILLVELFFGAVVSGYAGRSRLAPAAPKGSPHAFTNMIGDKSLSIEMAVLCVGKAVHVELRALCESMIAGRAGSSLQMRDRLQNWYDISMLPLLMPGKKMHIDALKELEGEAFELEFMTLLVRHNQQAVDAAGSCRLWESNSGEYPACRLTIQNQQSEIEQMEAWLCAWYGYCPDLAFGG